MGECKITEKIHTEPLDLSDAKFIDEKGHTINRDDALDWNEIPPLTIEGELSIEYPDGRVIKNPSPEEFLEWAKGTQIPVYYVDESEDKQ
jgi:hypothetical protein